MNNKIKKRHKHLPQIALNIFFTIFTALVIIPLLLVIAVSLSAEEDVLKYGYQLIPKRIDFAAYKFIFADPDMLLQAYKITIIYTVSSVFLSMIFKCMMAYALSKKDLPGRNAMAFFLYFPTLFSGGLVASYILITQYLHMGDTIWVYIIFGMVSAFPVFMIRTFFQGIPYEITEAAIIDGAGEYRILFTMIIPLSKPIIATQVLSMTLAKWNDWNTTMLYINNPDLFSLQYMLQRILQNISMLQQTESMLVLEEVSKLPSETARMAMAMAVAGPILVIFPFFQKYFAKGLTVGSVKG